MIDDLVIYQKTYDLLLWIYPVVHKFPKQQRFVLGQQIENAILDVLRGIVYANAVKQKQEALRVISVKLDTARILIRLAKDLKFISIKQYGVAAEKINEIGKLLQGLLKRFQ